MASPRTSATQPWRRFARCWVWLSACMTRMACWVTRRIWAKLAHWCRATRRAPNSDADISMLVMGGDLKRREKLSARLGDILSMMYLCSATLKRLRVGGAPGGRCAAHAPGDLGCHVKDTDGFRRCHLQFPEPLYRTLPVAPSFRSVILTLSRRTRLAIKSPN